MKKKNLTIVTAICALSLLVFACRKQLDNLIQSDQAQVSSGILESAKIFNAKALSGQTLQTSYKNPLKPLWDKSWTIDINGTTKLIAVPTIENYVTNNEVTIRRVFVFEAKNDNVVKGEIVELIGQNYDVKPQLNSLIKGLQTHTVSSDFSGAIIHYDLNYYRTSGILYSSGEKVHENVMITARSGGKDIYLMQLSDTGFGKRTFLYREDPKHRVLEAASNGGEISVNVVIYSGSGGSHYGGAPLIIPELPNITNGSYADPVVTTQGIQNDCVRAITNTLIGKNIRGRLASIIASVYGGTDQPDIEFTDQLPVTPGYAGEAGVIRQQNPPYKIEKIIIRLDANIMKNASEEFIAETVMHEAIHAYLTERSGYSVSSTQHLEMASTFVDMLSDSLVDMFPGITKDDSYALAWGGLEAEHQYMTDGMHAYSGPVPYFPQWPNSQVSIRSEYILGTKGRKCP